MTAPLKFSSLVAQNEAQHGDKYKQCTQLTSISVHACLHQRHHLPSLPSLKHNQQLACQHFVFCFSSKKNARPDIFLFLAWPSPFFILLEINFTLTLLITHLLG
jgi:hypothetical protein